MNPTELTQLLAYIKTASFPQIVELFNRFVDQQVDERILEALNQRGEEFNYIVTNPYWIDQFGEIHFDFLVEFTHKPTEDEPKAIFTKPAAGFPWWILIVVLLVIIILSYSKSTDKI